MYQRKIIYIQFITKSIVRCKYYAYIVLLYHYKENQKNLENCSKRLQTYMHTVTQMIRNLLLEEKNFLLSDFELYSQHIYMYLISSLWRIFDRQQFLKTVCIGNMHMYRQWRKGYTTWLFIHRYTHEFHRHSRCCVRYKYSY